MSEQAPKANEYPEIAKESHKRYHEWQIKLFESTINVGQNSTKSAGIANAGAAIAILTFISQVKNAQAVNSLMLSALVCFFAGFCFTVLASGATYLCQSLFTSAEYRIDFTLNHPFQSKTQGYTSRRNWGIAMQCTSIVLILASYCALVIGGMIVYSALSAFISTT